MKKIILLLFTAQILYAQFGNELVSNPTMESDVTGWAVSGGTVVQSSDQAYGGTYSAKFDAAAQNQYAYILNTVVTGDTLLFRGYIWEVAPGVVVLAQYTAGEFAFIDGTTFNADPPSAWTYVSEYGVVASGGSRRCFIIRQAAATHDILYFDDISLMHKIDTLWIDSNQADDTDNDSTKTLTEAFETRGAHSGGIFIVVAGTYAESVTIDSSFTKLEATGTTTITSIDFNNVTTTVDLANLTITTKLNDSNVTYLNEPVTDQTKGYDNNGGYGNYLR